MVVLDDIDRNILSLIQQNARLTIKEIAGSVNLTLTPVYDRIKRLENLGVIDKYVTLLNRKTIGKSLIAYCQISLVSQTQAMTSSFESAIQKMPEVIECQFIAGNFDYLLKVIIADMDAYHQLHKDRFSILPNIAQINSFFAMSEVKFTTAIEI